MSKLSDFITDFIPDDDATPLHMRNWRRRLALVACSSWLFLFTCLVPALVMLLFVGAPLIGRVAWADDQDRKTDHKIAEALKPMKSELEQVNTKLNRISSLVEESVNSSLIARLCATSAKRAKETDYIERQRLLNEINKMRGQYKELSGIDFRPEDC